MATVMENSTRSQREGNPIEGQWKPNWPPKPWIAALYRRLSLIYLQKFTSGFQENDAIEEWQVVWAEGLAGLTGDQIAFGLSLVTKELPWPPTIAEFRERAEALPKPIQRQLPLPTKVKSEYAEECMKVVREMFETKRKPGNWWAHEVLAKVARHEPVTYAAEQLARAALRGETREPGQEG